MKKSVVVLIVILLLLVLGMGGYLVYDKILSKDELKEKMVEEKQENSTKEETVEEKNSNSITASDLVLDSSKRINQKNMEYSLATNNDINGIYLTYYDGNVNISITPDVVKNSYNGINISNSSYTVNFNKKIVDIYVDGYGQSIGYETIFFLMEDGTVEYIPFYYACNNNSFKTVKLDGVENIIRFVSGSASPVEPGGGYHTILAQKQDGTFYDLSLILQQTQYYNNY